MTTRPTSSPGASIAGGRYRLLVFHGGPPGLQFWQALDTALDRQVALTFVDPDRTMTDAQVQEILSRTLKLSRLERAGHRSGARRRQHRDRRPGGLGVDPGRIAEGSGRHLAVAHRRCARHPVAGRGGRRRPPGRVSRCPSTTPAGCGSASKVMSRWPFRRRCRARPPRTTSAASVLRCTPCWSTAGRCRRPGVPSGLQPAETDPAGQAIEPRAHRRRHPLPDLGGRGPLGSGGRRDPQAPTLLNLLQQATAVADRTDLIEPVGAVWRRAPHARRQGADAEAQARAPAQSAHRSRRRRRDPGGRPDRVGLGAVQRLR